MTLDAWMPALGGGVLIGLAAVLLYATLGRIAGISGIGFGLVWGERGDTDWRIAFIAGLLAGGWLALALAGSPPSINDGNASPAWLVVLAGLLVGFGTRLGNGCTSGHGVCGLARLSPRSLVSVALFMTMGILTATLFRPLLA